MSCWTLYSVLQVQVSSVPTWLSPAPFISLKRGFWLSTLLTWPFVGLSEKMLFGLLKAAFLGLQFLHEFDTEPPLNAAFLDYCGRLFHMLLAYPFPSAVCAQALAVSI